MKMLGNRATNRFMRKAHEHIDGADAQVPDLDDRHARMEQCVLDLLAVVCPCQHHRVWPTADEVLQKFVLARLFIARLPDQQVIAVLPKLEVQRLDPVATSKAPAWATVLHVHKPLPRPHYMTCSWWCV